MQDDRLEILSRVVRELQSLCQRGYIQQMASAVFAALLGLGAAAGALVPGAPPGSAPTGVVSCTGFSGQRIWGMWRQEADAEPHTNTLSFASYLICCFGARAIASPRGKKCPEIPQTLQYHFCFTARQKKVPLCES